MKSLFSRITIAALAFLLTSCGFADNKIQEASSAFSEVILSDLTETSVIENTEQSNLTESSVTEVNEPKRVRKYELSKFTLTEPDHKKLRDNKEFATFNFDDNEIIELFDEAWYIKCEYFECMSGRFVFSDFGEMPSDDSEFNTFTYSGVSYDSFVNFLNCYFTEEYTEKLLEQGITEYGENNIVVPYKNDDGELCYSSGLQLGTTPLLDSITVNITDRTEEEINITVTARYCHPEIPDKEEFRDYDCIIKKTLNGWRVDYMKLWYWRK